MREQSERAGRLSRLFKKGRKGLLKLSSSQYLREIIWETREGRASERERERERANEREKLRACVHVRGSFTPLVHHSCRGKGAGGGLPRRTGGEGWSYTKQHLHPRDCELPNPVFPGATPLLSLTGQTVGLPEERLNHGYQPAVVFRIRDTHIRRRASGH